MIDRVGGEEFAVVSRVRGIDECTLASQRLMDKLHSGTVTAIDGRTFAMTVTVGVTYVRPADKPSRGMLLRQSDVLLYRAKTSGRDRIVTQACS